MPTFDPKKLVPAQHGDEPPKVMEGWRAADVPAEDLVDDEFIAADPDSKVVTDDGADLR